MYNYVVSFLEIWTQAPGSMGPRIRRSKVLPD